MKNRINSFLSTIVVAFLMVAGFSGCKTKCGDLECENGAECVDGKCECPEGYYGYECQFAPIVKVGGYSCNNNTCGYDENGEYASMAECLLDCGNVTSTAGYNCNQTGNCTYVSNNAQYGTLAECETACVPNTSGYSCQAGNCVQVASGAQYASLTSCQSQCQAYGEIIFWIASDLGCGVITVNLNGQNKTITNYSSSGVPPCGTQGFATFSNVPVGNQPWTASCNNGTWTYSSNVLVDQCISVELTN